jgi:hypothetical protein
MTDMNKIIESIGYRGDSYWGLPNKFLFKATIDNFPMTNQVTDGEDRKIISTFSITMNGYLTPNNLDKYLSTMPLKSFSKPKVLFTTEVSSKESEKLTVSSKKKASLGAVTYVPEGVNVYNTFQTNVVVSDSIINYLNTNISKKADLVSTNRAEFNNSSILQPPSGSNIPSSSISDFKFFANGVYIPQQHLISFNSSGSSLVLLVNTGSLGYSLDNLDEIIGVGKFS